MELRVRHLDQVWGTWGASWKEEGLNEHLQEEPDRKENNNIQFALVTGQW